MARIDVSEGYLIVRADLRNGLTGRFLLDTGADATVVSTALAGKLDLPALNYHESGVAGGSTIRVPLSRLDTLSIDGNGRSLDPVAIADLGDVSGPWGRIDGVIGSDYLKEFPVTIDYAEGELIFEDSSGLERRVASGRSVDLILRNGTTPFVAVRINGTLRREYKLDTGAAVTHVPLHDIAALGMDADNGGFSSMEAVGIGGTYTVLQGSVDSFSVCPGLEIADLSIKSYEAEYGFVGANYLRNFTVTLDYGNGRIILNRPSLSR